ncbi:MAG: hypothetical protein AB7K67_00995 [Hyphomicrobiaceae bacterium]
MPWIELKPGKEGIERITLSQLRGGNLIVGMSAAVARRNKIGADTRLRVLADLEASPRVVRLVVDPAGPFKVRTLKGDSATIIIGKLPGLGHIRVIKAECEFDEMTDEKKHIVVEIELPKALQVPERPLASVSPHTANGQSTGVRR